MNEATSRIVVHALILTIAWGMQIESVYGQSKFSKGHLKKYNPNELWVVFVQEDDCKGSYEQVIENELARSRIKRKTSWAYNELSLEVIVRCITSNSDVFFTVDVHFTKNELPTDPKPGEYDFVTLHYMPGYGRYGVSSNDKEGEYFIKNTLRESIEEAMTDYLKVNFDL